VFRPVKYKQYSGAVLSPRVSMEISDRLNACAAAGKSELPTS